MGGRSQSAACIKPLGFNTNTEGLFYVWKKYPIDGCSHYQRFHQISWISDTEITTSILVKILDLSEIWTRDFKAPTPTAQPPELHVPSQMGITKFTYNRVNNWTRQHNRPYNCVSKIAPPCGTHRNSSQCWSGEVENGTTCSRQTISLVTKKKTEILSVIHHKPVTYASIILHAVATIVM